MEPSILQVVFAVFFMLISIWFIFLGLGMFAEAKKGQVQFSLYLFLTTIGALCLCVSLLTLMIQAIKIVGVVS